MNAFIVIAIFLLLDILIFILVQNFTFGNCIYYLFLSCYLSIASSALGRNIYLLYIIILIQIITYIADIKILKTFNKKITYYVFFIIVSICIILSITCSYGYYYYEADIIEVTNLLECDMGIKIISNLINGILMGLYLFTKSLKYYFNFVNEFVPQTQFILGILISCIILESIFSVIRNFIKYPSQ